MNQALQEIARLLHKLEAANVVREPCRHWSRTWLIVEIHHRVRQAAEGTAPDAQARRSNLLGGRF
jgi:hypothetical protein